MSPSISAFNLLQDSSQSRVDGNVLSTAKILCILDKVKLLAALEDHAVAAATIVKHANFLASGNVLSLEDSGLTTAHFHHSDEDDAYQSDPWIVSLDVHVHSSGYLGNISLAVPQHGSEWALFGRLVGRFSYRIIRIESNHYLQLDPWDQSAGDSSQQSKFPRCAQS